MKTNEAVVSGDGFMCNVLTALQELSLPIKKEKIDLMSIFNSEISPIRIRDDDVRLNCDKDAYVAWAAGLRKLGDLNSILRICKMFHAIHNPCIAKDAPKPTFNTEIFFLTFYSHHISIIAIIHKHLRRIRVIKDLNR